MATTYEETPMGSGEVTGDEATEEHDLKLVSPEPANANAQARH
jgi:hypothetical protein